MRIDGITVCVGEQYKRFLKKSLPLWLDGLDSLTVVTVADGFDDNRIHVVETKVFTDYGASFNKAAALCVGYADINPTDVVLLFDADISPCSSWRKIVDKEFCPGWLFGATRKYADGRGMDTEVIPYGFFNLFHSRDINCLHWPLLEVQFKHAGFYDMGFAERWGKTKWHVIDLGLIHQGVSGVNWMGPNGDKRGMDWIRKVGFKNAERLVRSKPPSIPSPEVRLCIDPFNMDAAISLFQECMTDNPFLIEAYIGPWKDGYCWIDNKTDAIQLREFIKDLRCV